MHNLQHHVSFCLCSLCFSSHHAVRIVGIKLPTPRQWIGPRCAMVHSHACISSNAVILHKYLKFIGQRFQNNLWKMTIGRGVILSRRVCESERAGVNNSITRYKWKSGFVCWVLIYRSTPRKPQYEYHLEKKHAILLWRPVRPTDINSGLVHPAVRSPSDISKSGLSF